MRKKKKYLVFFSVLLVSFMVFFTARWIKKHDIQINKSNLIQVIKNINISEQKQKIKQALFRSSFKKEELVNVIGFLDEIGLYRKNGFVEVYGADFYQARRKPILVDFTQLKITHPNCWLIWHPDFSPIQDATHLELEFLDDLEGEVRIGFVMEDGKVFVFSHQVSKVQTVFRKVKSKLEKIVSRILPLKTVELDKSSSLPILIPNEYLSKVEVKSTVKAGVFDTQRLIFNLPVEMVNSIKTLPNNPISSWFLNINGAKGAIVSIKNLALKTVPVQKKNKRSLITLEGKISGVTVDPGTIIELLKENDQLLKTFVSLDNRFKFERVISGEPLSVRLKYKDRFYYSTLGRWFAPHYNRADIDIIIRPDYVNEDNHKSDPSQAKFVTPREPLNTAALYETHTRLYWPGSGSVQEYDLTTFTNNKGFVDYDRFYENPGSCFRVVQLGSSHAVSLQVPIAQKYNVLMEEELGVKLQRCVEVISAGVDNGDIGANYPRFTDYAVKFKPDLVLVESGSSLIAQLSPKLLSEGFGWDHEHSGTPNFYYNNMGELTFRLAAPDYGIYSVKPTFPQYIAGVPFFDTLRVPLSVMPDVGKEAYNYLNAIHKYFIKQYPLVKVVLHTGVDQAQAKAANMFQRELKTPDGKILYYGPNVFLENMKTFCVENNIDCINPSLAGLGNSDNLLTFQNDGHFSYLGHQWLARELSLGILTLLKNNSIQN